MAQQQIERQLPALEDLLERGIFTRDELQAVVAARREHEHVLARRTPLKADFLRAIAYELRLDATRRSRKKRLGLDRSSLGDFAGVKRVHFLFDRALRKFGSDLALWLRYLDFAKRTGSSKALSQIFPRMLQLHPRAPGVWVRAAAHEYEDRGNVAAARTLLQRALRVNGKYSRRLWLEYFRLEFLYLQKVMARKSVLGVLGGAGNAEGAGDVEGAEGPGDAVDAGEGGRSGGDDGDGEDGSGTHAGADAAASSAAAARAAFERGALPLVVFRSAIRTYEGEGQRGGGGGGGGRRTGDRHAAVAFRGEFLDICHAFLPTDAHKASETVSMAITQSLADDLPACEGAWELRATSGVRAAEVLHGRRRWDTGRCHQDGGQRRKRRRLDGGDGQDGDGRDEERAEAHIQAAEDAATAVFEAALAGPCRTTAMWGALVAFYRTRLATLGALAPVSPLPVMGAEVAAAAQRRRRDELVAALMAAFPRAENAGLMSASLYQSWIDALLRRQAKGDLLRQVCTRATDAFPSCERLWALRFDLCRDSLPQAERCRLLRRALAATSEGAAGRMDLWLRLVDEEGGSPSASDPGDAVLPAVFREAFASLLTTVGGEGANTKLLLDELLDQTLVTKGVAARKAMLRAVQRSGLVKTTLLSQFLG